MRKTLIAMMVMVGLVNLVGAYEIEGNPDRKLSIGLNYDHTGQNSEYTYRTFKTSDFTKVSGNSFLADIRIPLASIFTLSVRGGYSTQTNDIFTGEKIEYSGYDVGVGVRFYIP